ncbi:MAG: prepilin-type N-terminal cleavage/methylation domain-containing protein [Planctomycetes bacterium]|nr:prepilin-type N-terminal cleavage/methylation domain-containing protein [Planctomycetota bacterium]MCP4770338.1 prepilin-type N-terminal cleavage/methylation domain-containing protein [Planctomycetota bacterium]MCP4861912.1 prepilin-type N-terminal cleavage/methylation domain-containing protein [Planctomycetota bacterium]
MKSQPLQKQGFTLIEIVVAAAILLMLASMAVPAFQGTVADAEVAATRSMLARVRTAVDFYAFQHQEEMPGHDPIGGSWSSSVFSNQLRMWSDIDGNTAAQGAVGYPFGPYLNEKLPTNPYNGLATVTIVPPGSDINGPDDSTGWIYWAATGTFRINSTKASPDGEAVYDL